MKYLIVIEPTSTGFSAYSPDLPGCVSTGATRDEHPAMSPPSYVGRSSWIDRLPSQRLKSLADYVEFLDRPPLMRRVTCAELVNVAGKGKNWPRVRSDM
jgi:hypothetical protein